MNQPTIQSAEQVTLLPINRIRPSTNNPRKTSSEAALAELRESIASQGVLSPIVVRPYLPTDQEEGLIKWEVVFGHRRLAAADQAGLDTIPAIVRNMDDQEADLARLHENLEREDVHYIEEAEALQRLIDTHGLTVPQLMQQTGKPMVWVYGRLKLAKLHPAVREVCLAGTIGAEVAQLIGRVPQPLQPQAMDRCLETAYDIEGHPKRCRPFRWCRDELRRGFTIAIEQAPFDTGDTELARSFGGKGSCFSCQSLSDNDAALAELGPGLCCNPSCYQARAQAARDAQLEMLREQGRLREGQAASALLNSYDHVSLHKRVEGPGGVLMTVGELIEHAREHGGPKVEPAQIEAAITPHRDPATAPIVERVPVSVVAQLQAAFGVKPAEDDEDAEERDYAAEQEKRWEGVALEHRAVLDRAAWSKVQEAILAALPGSPGSAEDLRYIAITTMEAIGGIPPQVEALLGWPADIDNDDNERRRVMLLDSTPDQLALLMIGLAVGDDNMCNFMADEPGQAFKAHVRDRRLALAARHGVDVITASGLSVQDAAHPQADLLSALACPTPGMPAGGVQSGEKGGETHEQGQGDAAAGAADAQKTATSTATTAKGKGKAKGKGAQAACGGQKVTDDAACGGKEQMDDDAKGVGQTTTAGAQA